VVGTEIAKAVVPETSEQRTAATVTMVPARNTDFVMAKTVRRCVLWTLIQSGMFEIGHTLKKCQ
jgi:hypothetical protein